jgi:hypothetical protein
MFKWFSGLKIWAIVGAAFGALILALKLSNARRKAAEFEAETERGNRLLLQKEKALVSEIDKKRKAWEDKQAKEHIKQVQKLEKLKHETNDSDVVDAMLSMYNKNSSKINAHRNTK